MELQAFLPRPWYVKQDIYRSITSCIVHVAKNDHPYYTTEYPSIGSYSESNEGNTKSNLAAARSRKQNKEAYGTLFSCMQTWPTKAGQIDYETLEVGSLGHYQMEMRPLLSSALGLPKRPKQDLLDHCAKAAISCSYHIFLARNSPSWSPPSLLSF